MHAVTMATVPLPVGRVTELFLLVSELAFEAGDGRLGLLEGVEGAAEPAQPAGQGNPLTFQPGPQPLDAALPSGIGRRLGKGGSDDAAARGGHVRRPPRPGA